MQALNHTARRLGLVVGLLVLFLVLLSYQVNRTRTLSSARTAVFGLVSPFQRLTAAALHGIGSLWGDYHRLLDASEEAEELRGENARLRREIAALREVQRENGRLRAVVGLDPEQTRGARVARVIARDLSHRFEAVTIDRGGADGVAVDAAVISPDGLLVGRVVQAARWTSLVQLLTDPLSGVGARLAGSRATGLVAGTDSPRLQLQFVDSMTEVRRGELVITSGEDGIYPAGIPIGSVASYAAGAPIPGTPRVPLAREEAALFMDIAVTPGVDVLRLETVVVLAAGNDS